MKEEILSAISQLEKEILNMNEMITIDYAINRKLAANIINNKRVFIKALQEQLDRLEGCDKCKEPKCLTCKLQYSGCSYESDENICFDSPDSIEPNYKRYKCKYDFCPNCGRKLRGGE